MFEFGKELRRLFSGDGGFRFPQDGLTGGDAGLLELLDLRLLQNEGRASDAAAGRVSAKDRAQRLLESAIVWREIARRGGDAAALRKAAALAETAAEAFDRNRRPDGWARARCEQAFCAMLGAELFGDEGLTAAAEVAFREARAAARGGLAAPLADVGVASIEGRRRLPHGDAQAARIAAARFTGPITALQSLIRRCSAARLLLAEARVLRADLLAGWGARLKDRDLLRMALDEANQARSGLDADYEPLTFARIGVLRGQIMALLGEATGEIETIADGAEAIAAVVDELHRDHSPLDWGRSQWALGQAVQILAEASASERAYERAIICYERADHVFKRIPSLALRAVAASNRALCLARSAELTGDLGVLDAAEAAFKIELTTRQPRHDPVGWALAQVNLARVYEARMEITGRDNGERTAAATALTAAFDVFAEEGLRTFSLIAIEALERLRGASPSARPA